ncbi:MAG: tetratricopeptide repeat protein [Deltaproteobacteria bacterium]|nr:tetratricopeptide repeat protein [Deltaproteobacteria bacterium]
MKTFNPRTTHKSRIAGQKSSGAGALRWLIAILIVPITITVFSPALENGFVDWDDHATLVENERYRGLGWPALRWMFTTFYMGHYQPLSWLTFSLDYLIWGLDPFGYHLTNILLHAANALIFYFIALSLISEAFSPAVSEELPLQAAAALATIFFALHPLRVESVAWATQRRDLLSGAFYLLTVLSYLKAARAEKALRRRWLAGAIVVYSLSLLSKSTGITLPIVLVVLDVYPLRRLDRDPRSWVALGARGIWREKVPFFLLAIPFGVVALAAQQEAGALKQIESYSFASRLAQALLGITFYLWKTIFPLGLSPLYELPRHFTPWDWPFLFSGAMVVAATITLFLLRGRWPAGLAVWVYYVVLLAPVSGIAQSGPQIAADRYSYLSCLGWTLLAGAAFFYCARLRLIGRQSPRIFVFAGGLALAASIFLGILTWGQAQVWHNSERLWRHALAVTGGSSTIHYNLAAVLHQRGELAEAKEHYQKSLEHNPLVADAHYNLGNVLAEQARLEEAMEHYRQAITIDPRYWDAHNNLAILLEQTGGIEEAMKHYRRALEINPAAVEAHNNLGLILAGRGEFKEAVLHFEQALKIKPDLAGSHYSLGKVLAAQGRLDNAIEQFREALRLQPDFAGAHENLGRALAQQGKRDEAVNHYQEALRILKSRAKSSPQS